MLKCPGQSFGLESNLNESELFRAISNQFDRNFVSRLMKNGQKSIRLIPFKLEESIQMNRIRINRNQSKHGFIQIKFFNPNYSDLTFSYKFSVPRSTMKN